MPIWASLFPLEFVCTNESHSVGGRRGVERDEHPGGGRPGRRLARTLRAVAAAVDGPNERRVPPRRHPDEQSRRPQPNDIARAAAQHAAGNRPEGRQGGRPARVPALTRRVARPGGVGGRVRRHALGAAHGRARAHRSIRRRARREGIAERGAASRVRRARAHAEARAEAAATAGVPRVLPRCPQAHTSALPHRQPGHRRALRHRDNRLERRGGEGGGDAAVRGDGGVPPGHRGADQAAQRARPVARREGGVGRRGCLRRGDGSRGELGGVWRCRGVRRRRARARRRRTRNALRRRRGVRERGAGGVQQVPVRPGTGARAGVRAAAGTTGGGRQRIGLGLRRRRTIRRSRRLEHAHSPVHFDSSAGKGRRGRGGYVRAGRRALRGEVGAHEDSRGAGGTQG